MRQAMDIYVSMMVELSMESQIRLLIGEREVFL